MLRTSDYNICLNFKENSDQCLMIQGVNGSFDIVEKKYAKIVEEYKDDINKIEELPEDIRESLIKRGYITSLSEDDEFKFITKLCEGINLRGRKKISITLLPTYNCNFRCEYCFERNLQCNGADWLNGKMSFELIDAIFRKLKSAKEEGYKLESIYLFGGEPLLRNNYDIVNRICEKAREIEMPICCISNGYDLDTYIDLIREFNFRYVQITIDGIGIEHDKRRYLAGGQGTYDRIMKNVELGLEKGINIVLRTNVNTKNLEAISALIDFYKENGWTEKPNFSYYFKTTMKCYDQIGESLSEVELMTKMAELYGEDISKFQFNSIYQGLSTRLIDMIENNTYAPFRSGYCGANMGMYTIDPYGDIYPCWDVLSEKDHAIGKVNVEEGEFEFNENFQKWKGRTVDKLDECKKCKYMMFCGGGCTAQSKVLYDDIYRAYCDDFVDVFNQVAVDICSKYLDS